MEGIFNEAEKELIEAAQIVLREGVLRLKSRGALYATNIKHDRATRQEVLEARIALTDSLVAHYGSLRHEVMVMVLIDAQGRLISIEELCKGNARKVSINCREIAACIIANGADSVMLAHNHPSGDNTPSQQDVDATKQLGVWLAAMEVQLIDHIVLNGEGASSIMGKWL